MADVGGKPAILISRAPPRRGDRRRARPGRRGRPRWRPPAHQAGIDRPAQGAARARLPHHRRHRRLGAHAPPGPSCRVQRGGRLQQYRRRRGDPGRRRRHQYPGRPHRDHRGLRLDLAHGHRPAPGGRRPLCPRGQVHPVGVHGAPGRRHPRENPRRGRASAASAARWPGARWASGCACSIRTRWRPRRPTRPSSRRPGWTSPPCCASPTSCRSTPRSCRRRGTSSMPSRSAP